MARTPLLHPAALLGAWLCALVAGAEPAPPPADGPSPAAGALDVTGMSARVEPDPVEFGATFELVIEVEHDPSLVLSLPESLPEKAETPRAGPVRREQMPAGSTDAPARVRTRWRVPYLALDLEELETPALVLKTPEGERLEVPALPLRVRQRASSAPPDATAPGSVAPASPSRPEGADLEGGGAWRPAPGPRTFRVFDARPLYALGLLAGAALAAWVIMRVRRHLAQRPPPPAPPPPPPRPADELALERLDALLAEGLLARGEVALFVARLMDEVLRDYLEARFEVAAVTQTTRELVEQLLSTRAPGLDVARVRALLEQVDLVKFARAGLAAEAAHAMAGAVRQMVLDTRPDRGGA